MKLSKQQAWEDATSHVSTLEEVADSLDDTAKACRSAHFRSDLCDIRDELRFIVDRLMELRKN